MTTRARSRFLCEACGHLTPVWSGRCAGCDGWNTLIEQAASAAVGSGSEPTALRSVSTGRATPVSVGVDEFDRVLSGGLVPGSVTLLSGPPGIGKSTLALEVAARSAAAGEDRPVIYVTAEETVAQIRLRADRLGLPASTTLAVTDDGSVDALAAMIDSGQPALVVVDSIQTVTDPSVGSVPGSVAQVRACAQRLAAVARAVGTSLVLIGHVTKDGAIAGPRTLEHLVDTVVTFDADGDQNLRFLRATKHRYGPVGELGVFTMGGGGLSGVPDVAGLFLGDRRPGVAGSVVTPVCEGRRTIAVEVQSLVDPSGPGGCRVCQGVQRSRAELVRVVLDRHIGLRGDVFVSVAGGVGVTEPAPDLAIAVAIVSASTGVSVDAGTVVCGEVGLVGEIRGVASIERRLTEVARLGFARAIVPRSTPEDLSVPGMAMRRVADVHEAVDAAFGVNSTVRVLGRPRTGSDTSGSLQREERGQWSAS